MGTGPGQKKESSSENRVEFNTENKVLQAVRGLLGDSRHDGNLWRGND